MRKKRNEALVGMFVLVGFIMLALTVFFISGVYFFKSGYSLNVKYDYVSILDRGAPVRMAGVRIGEVSDVSLVHDEETAKTRVIVKLFIEEGVKIRENYLFKIQGTHILSEPHIEITPVAGEAPFLEDGRTIEGESPVAVEALIERAHKIGLELDNMLSRINLILSDQETGEALKQMIFHFSKLTETLDNTFSGSEKDMQETINNLKTSTESLDKLLNGVTNGDGTLGKLLYEDDLYQEVRDFVAEIKAHPWRLLKKDKK